METGPREKCMYCFGPLDKNGECPACGKDPLAPVSPSHLAPGTVLRTRFLVGRALGQDAGGIVYVAHDLKTGAKLRVREYFRGTPPSAVRTAPFPCARRGGRLPERPSGDERKRPGE
jgi:hypothetical protein